MGKIYLDIREYIIGPDPYEGFTKCGVRIPIALVGQILKGLETGLHNHLNELEKKIQKELAELIKGYAYKMMCPKDDTKAKPTFACEEGRDPTSPPYFVTHLRLLTCHKCFLHLSRLKEMQGQLSLFDRRNLSLSYMFRVQKSKIVDRPKHPTAPNLIQQMFGDFKASAL